MSAERASNGVQYVRYRARLGDHNVGMFRGCSGPHLIANPWSGFMVVILIRGASSKGGACATMGRSPHGAGAECEVKTEPEADAVGVQGED